MPASVTGSRWTAFAVAVSVAALTILDISKINVGLPSIEKALGAGSTSLQLIVAGYTLAFGLALVPAGRIGDLFSRRIMFLVGLALFGLTSLGCALAPTDEVLIVFRILQGVAAGIQMPQVLGLVQQLFQGAERGRAFGLFGAIIGLSTAFGPTLGGLLILVGGPEDGWRLLFWMNVPIAAVLWVIAFRLLPRTQRHRPGAPSLDPVGVLILAVAIFALLFPFVSTTGRGDPPERWFVLVGFAAAGAGFVLWERRYRARGRTPIVDFALFRDGGYRNGILIATSYFAAIPATFLCLTLFLQEGLRLEPVFAGMVTIPFALTSAASSLISGRLVNRVGRPLVIGGLLVVITGLGLNLLLAEILPPASAPWGMAVGMLVAGIGGGAIISPNQTLTLAGIRPEQGGVAGSIGQLGQRVGTAIGLSAATAAFYAVIGSGGGARLDLYHEAFRNAALVSACFLALAVVFALAEQFGRVRARRSDTVRT
ncbi:MAG: MFS transporter [Micrococcales bacterium]|nr:MFS transporter [Micrococcales bacterium]